MQKIKAYLMDVDEKSGAKLGKLIEIDNTRESLQCILGGGIEIFPLQDEITLLMNSEWGILKLPYNRCYVLYGEVLNVLGGTLLAVREEGGKYASIQEEDISIINKYLYPIIQVEGHSVILHEDMLRE